MVWFSPTGYQDSAGWINPGNAYDDDYETFTWCFLEGPRWSSYLVLTVAPIVVTGIKCTVSTEIASVYTIEVDVLRSGVWVNVANADLECRAGCVIENEFDSGVVSAMRIRFYSDTQESVPRTVRVQDVRFFGSSEPSFSLVLGQGANFISMPLIPLNPDPRDIFGQYESIGTVFYWKPGVGWVTPNNLECKKGYYIFTGSDVSVLLTGDPCTVTLQDLITIYDGLEPGDGIHIGTGSVQIDVSGSELRGNIKGYRRETDEWYVTNLLVPGLGYWLERPEGAVSVSVSSQPSDGVQVFVDGKLVEPT